MQFEARRRCPPVALLWVLMAVTSAADDLSQRRGRDVVVLVHRGASDHAVENTLAAYEAAFRLGADALEVDIQRTRDGRLVTLHDPALHRVLDHYGPVAELTYEELLLYPFRDRYGVTRANERVPLLSEVLALAEKYNGLLSLDVKLPGLDDQLLELLERADAFEHILFVTRTAPAVRADPRISFIGHRGGMINGKRNDYAVSEVAAVLRAKPGPGFVMLDDPRLLLTMLDRPARASVHLPRLAAPAKPAMRLETLWEVADARRPQAITRRQALGRILLFHPQVARDQLPQRAVAAADATRADWIWAAGRQAARTGARPPEIRRLVLRELKRARDERLLEAAAEAAGALHQSAAAPLLVRLLQQYRAPDTFATDDEQRARDAQRIRLRTAAIKALGLIGVADEPTLQILRRGLDARSLHLDRTYSGLDGAEAALALARLDPHGAVPLLGRAFQTTDPRLEQHRPLLLEYGNHHLTWDFLFQTACVNALVEIPTGASRRMFFDLLDRAGRGPPQLWRLYRHGLRRALWRESFAPNGNQIRQLTRHPLPGVQRAVNAFLVRQTSPAYDALRRELLPWSQKLQPSP